MFSLARHPATLRIKVFENADDVVWTEAGCTTELDHTERTSWILFLKYLDALELDKAAEAAFPLERVGGAAEVEWQAGSRRGADPATTYPT